MDGEAWQVYSPWGHKRVGHDLATKQQQVASRIAKKTQQPGLHAKYRKLVLQEIPSHL